VVILNIKSISLVPVQLISVLKDQATTSFSDQNKKIIAISLVAFGCLAACLLLLRHCFGKDHKPADMPNQSPKIQSVDLSTMSDDNLFYHAFDLMFSERTLEWGNWVGPFTPEQMDERHRTLIKVIEKLPNNLINEAVNYREGMNTRAQTLLLQAIMEIHDADKRLEIVQLLLNKGADPSEQGFYYSDVDPIREAERTRDQQLIDLLQDARG